MLVQSDISSKVLYLPWILSRVLNHTWLLNKWLIIYLNLTFSSLYVCFGRNWINHMFRQIHIVSFSFCRSKSMFCPTPFIYNEICLYPIQSCNKLMSNELDSLKQTSHQPSTHPSPNNVPVFGSPLQLRPGRLQQRAGDQLRGRPQPQVSEPRTGPAYRDMRELEVSWLNFSLMA